MNLDKIDIEIAQTVDQLANSCIQTGLRIAVAESCTGGWVSRVITDIAGSSDWFDCGFVTYSNDAKQRMLSVPESTLLNYGAVSKETVSEMSKGVLQHSNASLSVAISGIAGPTGGTTDKPVGLVWFGYANNCSGDLTITTEHAVFDGERNEVRGQSVLAALSGLIKIIDTVK